jgi:hypothetical protein
MNTIILNGKKAKIRMEAHLSFRDSANDFFDELEKLACSDITLDFSGVQTISRSYAQQLLTRTSHSKTSVICVNRPDDIKKMFEIVKAGGDKPNVVSEKLAPIDMSAIVL